MGRFGFPKLGACAGMLIFTQYWFWYPYLHFLNLSFSTCALIGLNSKF